MLFTNAASVAIGFFLQAMVSMSFVFVRFPNSNAISIARELDIGYSIRMKVFTLFDILKATLISKKKITEKK